MHYTYVGGGMTAVSQDKEKYKEIPLIERGPPDMAYAVTSEERKQIIIIVVGYWRAEAFFSWSISCNIECTISMLCAIRGLLLYCLQALPLVTREIADNEK